MDGHCSRNRRSAWDIGSATRSSWLVAVRMARRPAGVPMSRRTRVTLVLAIALAQPVAAHAAAPPPDREVAPHPLGLVLEAGLGGPLQRGGLGVSVSVDPTWELGGGVGTDGDLRPAFWLRWFAWQSQHLRLGASVGVSWWPETIKHTFREPHRAGVTATFAWKGPRVDAGIVVATLFGGLLRLEPGVAVLLAKPTTYFDAEPWLDVNASSPLVVPQVKLTGAWEIQLARGRAAPSSESRVLRALHASALASLVPEKRGLGGRLEVALNPGAPLELRLGALGFVAQELPRRDLFGGAGAGARLIGCLGDECRWRAAAGASIVRVVAGENRFAVGLGELVGSVRFIGPLALEVGALGATYEEGEGGTAFMALSAGWHGLFAAAGLALQGPFIAAGGAL